MLDTDITLFQYAEDINCIKTDGHTHDWIELFYQVSGEKVHCIDGTFCFTRKGDMLLIAPRTAHRTTFAGKRTYSRYCIGFYAGFVKEIPELYEALCAVISKNKFIIAHFDDADRTLVTSLFAAMYAGYRAQEPDSKTTLRMGTALCLLRMLRSYSTVGLQEKAPYLYIPVWAALCGAKCLEVLCRVLGKEPPVTYRNIKSTVTDRTFDISKAKAELGYAPQVGFREGILQTVAYYKQHGLL